MPGQSAASSPNNEKSILFSNLNADPGTVRVSSANPLPVNAMADGFATEDIVRGSVALPNNTNMIIDLGRLCKKILLYVPTLASCFVDVIAPASAAVLPLDSTMMLWLEVSQGTRYIYVRTTSNMSAYNITYYCPK